MRAIALPLSLALAFATLPSWSQTTRFIKVDVVDKSGKHMNHQGKAGPNEVHVRVPVTLAKGVLESFADQEIHLDGTMEVDGAKKHVDKVQKFKVDQLVKLLENTKPGDLLLEVNTNDGTHVKITIE